MMNDEASIQTMLVIHHSSFIIHPSGARRYGMHGRPRPRFLSDRFGGNYAPLLMALLSFFALAPLLATGLRGARALEAAYLIVALLGFRGVTSSRRSLIVVSLITAVAYGLHLLGAATVSLEVSSLANLVIFALIIILPVLILRDVLHHRTVTIDTIFGSLCVYIMISVIAAFVFRLIFYFDETSFAFAVESKSPLDDFLYFSMVTITTVGYGDILPRTPVARSAAALLALTGQLYLVVLVAYLVGLRITHSQAGKY
jgi:voltage-gated potassium channel